MVEVFVVYAIGYAVSAVLISGWNVAYFSAKYPEQEDRRSAWSYGVATGVLGSVFWPVILPLEFCASEFARHGWGYKGS